MACVYFPQYRSQNVKLLELIYVRREGKFASWYDLYPVGAIGRTLIPRYFSTVFEGGVTDLYYILKHSKESYHNSSITVDCDQCAMVTQHGKPMFTKVCTEGRLILEFTFDDLMRIKTWHFTIRQYRELVPRSILAMHAQDPQVLDQLSKNITRMGLTNFTLNYLRHLLSVWMTPRKNYPKADNVSPIKCFGTVHHVASGGCGFLHKVSSAFQNQQEGSGHGPHPFASESLASTLPYSVARSLLSS
ncbi:hypothetical protein FD755_022888 [Muntiacus reevesi]|uniref:LIM interaction domain-containing protein n=1 Tax=Muntiacus reevesi TaxID=9886 RepID=A0A5N3VYS7_MUNRE|nr:hypothetical protein FD755_022888 [Muntiacus reevesi]